MQLYDEVEYFLVIASTLNLSHAARALYLSTPALSTFLNKLESDLGVTLFTRSKDSLKLTPAGEIYYRNAKQIAALRDDTLQRLKQFAAPDSVRVRIGAAGRRPLNFLEALWPELHRVLPDCALLLQDSTPEGIYARLRDGWLDLGFGVLDWARQKDFSLCPLAHEEIGLAIPEEHPLIGRLRGQGLSPDDPADISVCRDETLVLSERVSVLARTCIRYFKQERFTPLRVSYTLTRTAARVARLTGAVHLTTEGSIRGVDGLVFQRLKDPMYLDQGVFFLNSRGLTQADQLIIAAAQENRDRI